MTQTGGVCEFDPYGPTARNTSASSTRATETTLVAVTVALTTVAAVHQVPFTTVVVLLALLPAAVVDLRESRVPDQLVGTAAFVGVVLLGAEHLIGTRIETGESWPLVETVALGALVCAGPLLLMHLMSPSSMGFGDVKTAVVLGGATALVHPLTPLLILTIAGLVASAAGVAGHRRVVPLGPALVGGAAAAIILTPVVIGP